MIRVQGSLDAIPVTQLDVVQGVHQQECVAFRVVARRADRVRHIGEASPQDVTRVVAIWQRAMPGWSVTTEEEHFRRWVSGDEAGPSPVNAPTREVPVLAEAVAR